MADWHPTEDELVLQFYGELTDEERATIEEHLAACRTCASAMRALGASLDQIDAAPVPEPDAGFEDRVWARLRQEFPARRATGRDRRWVVAGALAAVFIATLVTGYLWVALRQGPVGSAPSATEQPTDGPADTRERVLLTALNDHFSQTEILLVELLNARPVGKAGWAFQRTTADDLVASGRLYRATARQDGELQLANMLEDLEGVLVEVATAPETVDRRDVDFLRARIEDDALLFKVRAVATDIRGRQERLFHSE